MPGESVIGGDPDARAHRIRGHLEERRAATDGEILRLREELGALAGREAVLREEVALLDAVLAAIPVPPTESEAPSLFAPPPKSPSAPAPAASPVKRRRRKGSRMEGTLPRMRERFPATFTTEDVTNLLLELEGGDHRRAYFAAYSLLRDLAEDGTVVVASVETTPGGRKRRAYRFPEEPPTAGA